MANVVIMTGLPGSGKTTLAKLILQDYLEKWPGSLACIVSADNYFVEGDEYKFDGAKIQDAHNYCLAEYCRAIAHGYDLIIVDNTNLKAAHRFPYNQMAIMCGYRVSIVEPQNEWSKDPIGCFNHCVHNVPLPTIEKMSQLREGVA